jgi:hypothetical protein
MVRSGETSPSHCAPRLSLLQHYCNARASLYVASTASLFTILATDVCLVPLEDPYSGNRLVDSSFQTPVNEVAHTHNHRVPAKSLIKISARTSRLQAPSPFYWQVLQDSRRGFYLVVSQALLVHELYSASIISGADSTTSTPCNTGIPEKPVLMWDLPRTKA